MSGALWLWLFAWCIYVAVIGGCQSPDGSIDQKATQPAEHRLAQPAVHPDHNSPPATEASPGANSESGPGAAPMAYINGEPIGADAMRTRLMEAAGGRVLSEIVLDHMLRRRLSDQGMTLTRQRVAAEKKLLLNTLSRSGTPRADTAGNPTSRPDKRQRSGSFHDTGLAPLKPKQGANKDRGVLLLRRIREQRGLGEARFQSLLRRNAMLRLLVRDQVHITPAALQRAYQLDYGRKYRARVIVTPTLREAARLRQRLEKDHASSDRFSELAADHSIDPSAAAGGLLPPISPVDPAMPEVIRKTLVKLEKQGDRLSEVVALDNGYALLKLVRKIAPAAVEFADVKGELTRQVRRSSERVLMRKLARKLLSRADVTVLNPALEKRWRQQKQTLLGR